MELDSLNELISDLKTKIKVEQKVKEGAEGMLQALSNPESKLSCQDSILETKKRLDYLFGEMNKLQSLRKELYQIEVDQVFLTASSTSLNLDTYPPRKSSSKLSGMLKRFTLSRRQSDSSINSIGVSMPDLAQTPAVTTFGYIRSDTTITRDKVQYLIHEIQRKLDIERRIKDGTLKMLEANTNSKSKRDLEAKYNEGESKIQILAKSLSNYQSINLGEDGISKVIENNHNAEGNGQLIVNIYAISGMTKRKSSKSEMYCVITVDNSSKAITKISKSNWSDDLKLKFDKGKEVELSVYEQDGTALGMVWFHIGDYFKELERINPENKTLDVWLDLLPVGKIKVAIKFEAVKTKTSNHALVRSPGIQKISLQQGHKFTSFNSYGVMKCAVCHQYITAITGGPSLNCQLCDFTCHKKCFGKVSARCISMLSSEVSDADLSSNHRIPHRFQKAKQVGINWCDHCGKMFNIGSEEYTKCIHCNMSAHEECGRRIPDLCGLQDEMLEQLRNVSLPSKTYSHASLPVSKSVTSLDKTGSKTDMSIFYPPSKSHSELNITLPSIGLSTFKSAESLMGSTPALDVKNEDLQPLKPPSEKRKVRDESLAYFRHGSKGVGLEDFTFLAVLGKGNFGKVMLAQEKFTNNYYGIKVLKKEFILEHDEVDSTQCEKRCFQVATKDSHPFLVNLHSCFQTESRLYFVMEYVSGGDLMWHIQHRKFTVQQAKFYACEVLLALEYWHKNNIMYRDLKLDNILLTVTGHVKIADYGLCKERMYHGSTTNTFCGTPEFMAPEILNEKPYTRAVDWWSFGVLLYEMLLGKAPFAGDTEDRIFNSILKSTPIYPSSLAPEAVDIMKRLLTKDPIQRLGYGPGDASDIKKHVYFSGVNWDDVYLQKITPPYLPKSSGPTDLSNFDDEFTNEMPVLTPVHSVLSTANQEEFRGFTYVSDWAKASRAAVLPKPAT